jgi:hypothetical protein
VGSVVHLLEHHGAASKGIAQRILLACEGVSNSPASISEEQLCELFSVRAFDYSAADGHDALRDAVDRICHLRRLRIYFTEGEGARVMREGVAKGLEPISWPPIS